MLRYEKIEFIVNSIKPYKHPKLLFTKSSLSYHGVPEITKLYEAILDSPRKIEKCYKRPYCKISKLNNHPSGRIDYKEGMAKYISQWGIEFKTINIFNTSLLETLANYLEHLD